jgi:hypothetical protein
MPLYYGADTTVLQAAAAATGNGTVFPMGGRQSAVFQVTGTFVGTVTWEGTVDGTNWGGVAVADLASTTRARALTTTAPAIVLLDGAGGLQSVRARVSAWTSGTITVTGSVG